MNSLFLYKPKIKLPLIKTNYTLIVINLIDLSKDKNFISLVEDCDIYEETY